MKKFILAAALASGCAPAPVTPERQLSAVLMLDISVDGLEGHCTVWHLSGKSWMTAGHCAEEPTATYSANGQPFYLVKADQELDLALFEGPKGAPDLKLGTMPLFGAPVHYIGYPWYDDEEHLGVYEGRWGTCGNSEQAESLTKGLCEFSGIVDGGASGSPLLDEMGKVVGVISAAWDGRPYSFAVPVTTIKKFLDGVEDKI